MADEENKRRHRRIPVFLPVYFQEELRENYLSMIVDYSEGGIFLYTDRKLAVGDRLKIKMFKSIGDTEPHVFYGTVVHQRKDLHYGYGVQLAEIEENTLQRLIETKGRSLQYAVISLES
jgi:hypothetical protein